MDGIPLYSTSTASPTLGQVDEKISPLPEAIYSKRIPDGDRRFGFWPQSHNSFIGTGQYGHEESKTWFFSEEGKFMGWMYGYPFAYAADGKSIMIKTPDHRIVTLAPNLSATRVAAFEGNHHEAADPQEIYDDIHTGFLFSGGKLVLASWANPEG